MKLLSSEGVAGTTPVWPMISTAEPGIGLLFVFIGLKGSAKELGLSAHNGMAFTSFDEGGARFLYFVIDECARLLND